MALTLETVKRSMNILNIFLVICGLSLVVVGVNYLEMLERRAIIRESCSYSPWYFILIFALLVLLLTLGSVATKREDSYLLLCYVLSLSAVCFVQTGMVATSLVHLDTLKENIAKKLEEIFGNYNPSDFTNVIYVNDIHLTFKCCGIYGPSYWKKRYLSIPPSCCGSFDDCRASSPKIHNRSCFGKIYKMIYAYEIIIIVMLFVSIMVEVGAVIWACYLRQSVQSRTRRSREQI